MLRHADMHEQVSGCCSGLGAAPGAADVWCCPRGLRIAWQVSLAWCTCVAMHGQTASRVPLLACQWQ
jgi:hypothetical protein